MSASCSDTTADFYQPLGESSLARAAETLRAKLRKRLQLWRERRQSHAGRVAGAFSDMSLHMLRDVGAPDWLIDRAAEERRQQQLISQYLGYRAF